MNVDQKILFWKNSVAFQIFDGHEVSEDLIQIARKKISKEKFPSRKPSPKRKKLTTRITRIS